MPRPPIGSQQTTQSTQATSFEPTMDPGFTRETHLQLQGSMSQVSEYYPDPTPYAIVQNPASENQSQTESQVSQTPAQVLNPVLRSGTGSEDDVYLGDSDFESGDGVVVELDIKAGETMGEWYARASRELRKNLNDSGAALRIPKAPRKSKAPAKKVDWSEQAAELLDMFTNTEIRLLYLCDLNKVRLNIVMKFFFRDLPPEELPQVYGEARRISYGNFNSWKCKTIKEFRKYIADLAAKNKTFARFSEISNCQVFLEGEWKLDTFLSIFKFARDTVDFKASDKRVEKWCKIVFVDMGANLKMEWNNTHGIRNPALKLKCNPKYGKDYTGKRWDLYGIAEKYDTLRPDIGAVKIKYQAPSTKRVAAQDCLADDEIIEDMYLPDDIEEE